MLPRALPDEPIFTPPLWARGPVMQTLVPLLPFRTWGTNEMVRNEREEVVRLSHGVSVHGTYSAHTGGVEAKGLAIMLSGWEGHARSPYMLRTGRTLYREGYEVYRITYPDHGDTHDLNEAVFHFGMLDKIAEAIARIVGAIRTRPVVVLGFSMGGNVALNLACRGMPGMKAVVAVSPAFDFGVAMKTLQSSVFHSTFLKSWKSSLERKQSLFPQTHDFKGLSGVQTVGEVASDLVNRQGNVPSFEDYASRFSLTAEKLKQSMVPMHVITSTDDPIVGRFPHEKLAGIERLKLHLQTHGGHVGFIESLFGPAWYEQRIVELLKQALAPRPRLMSTGAAEGVPPPE